MPHASLALEKFNRIQQVMARSSTAHRPKRQHRPAPYLPHNCDAFHAPTGCYLAFHNRGQIYRVMRVLEMAEENLLSIPADVVEQGFLTALFDNIATTADYTDYEQKIKVVQAKQQAYLAGVEESITAIDSQIEAQDEAMGAGAVLLAAAEREQNPEKPKITIAQGAKRLDAFFRESFPRGLLLFGWCRYG
jgi:hypothetical protein